MSSGLTDQDRAAVLAYAMVAPEHQNPVHRAVSCLHTRMFGPLTPGYGDRVVRHNIAFRPAGIDSLRSQGEYDAQATPEAYARICGQLQAIADELTRVSIPQRWAADVEHHRAAIAAYRGEKGELCCI